MIQEVKQDFWDLLASSDEDLRRLLDVPPLKHPRGSIFVAIFSLAIALVGLGFAVYGWVVLIEIL